jgi:hypothetical protein
MTTFSKPPLEHVQVKKLARVALVLSTIAALPGLLSTPLGLVVSLQGVLEQNSFVFPLGIFGMMGVGWWLYWTYWREVNGNNRQGKSSWLVSALFNGGLATYQGVWLYHIDANTTVNFLGYGAVLLWVLVMTVISLWVWGLKMRETL